MKKISFLLLIIIMIAFSSCSTYLMSNNDKLMALELGMTPKEIVKLLGKPYYRTKSDANNETWEYRHNVYKGNDMIKIVFENNKVASFDSYFLPEITVPQNTDTKTD